MFYYLEGAVTVIEPNLAVLDVNGAGYACHVTAGTLSRIETGKKTRFYTYCNIREDAFDIYGFLEKGEKRCFEMLIGVSGVGPKAALGVLSVCTPESLALAVVNDDTRVITLAPGVGKKLAQRIILELKDKMSRDTVELAGAGYVPPSGGAANAQDEAAAALAVLGYTPGEIARVLRGIDTAEMTTEQIIREALKASNR